MSKKTRSCNRNTFWIYGKHAVRAAISNESREILRLIFLESCKNFIDECEKNRKNGESIKTEVVDGNYFAAQFGKDATHQGCAVLVRNLHNNYLDDVIEDPSDNRPIVFLDQITDPQNIGSILRASAIFGARAVVVTEHNTPEFAPSMWKAASGAAELIPLIRVVNIVHAINNLKKCGFWCIGLDERSNKKIYELSLNGKFMVVIGGEEDGMRRLTRESCDFLAQLPSFGAFATLNAAQAATVALYEIHRQRLSSLSGMYERNV